MIAAEQSTPIAIARTVLRRFELRRFEFERSTVGVSGLIAHAGADHHAVAEVERRRAVDVEDFAIEDVADLGVSAQISVNTALIALEQGDLPVVRSSLITALDRAPATPARPLLRLYWYLVTNEFLDIEPPGDWIPGGRDIFVPDTEAEPPAEAGGQN